MRFSLAIFVLMSACLTGQAALASSGFEMLSQLASGEVYTGRIQNGAPLGACQSRITINNNDGSVFVEMAYGAGTKQLAVKVSAKSQVDVASSALLVYEGQDGSGVQVGHLNNRYFQLNVTQASGGPSVTCGSFAKLLR
jgi:hypothetical protein